MSELKNYAIILASGSGTRFGSEKPKQFMSLGGKTIFEHTITVFQNSPLTDEIIIATNHEYIEFANKLVETNKFYKVTKIIAGGKTRKDSSYNAVHSIEQDEGKVLIHDCARPFVTQNIIEDCYNALEEYDAITTAIPVIDTIVEIKDNKIINIPKREKLNRVQTPQGFKLSLIKKAHNLSVNDNDFTDDCGLIIKHKLAEIHIVAGSPDNIKITYPKDLILAREILKNKLSTSH